MVERGGCGEKERDLDKVAYKDLTTDLLPSARPHLPKSPPKQPH